MIFMNKLNKKGFSKLELLTIIGLLAILIAVGAKLAIDSSKDYKSFKNLANNFVDAVSLYKDKYNKPTNRYFLKEVIEKDYSKPLKNPWGSEYCDEVESYVDIPDASTKQIHLVCGSYIVEGEQSSSYKVYEVSEWSDEKPDSNVEMGILYNYEENGKVVLSEYQSELTFINSFLKNTGMKLSNPFDVDKMSGMKLLHKTVYRTKELLKEVK